MKVSRLVPAILLLVYPLFGDTGRIGSAKIQSFDQVEVVLVSPLSAPPAGLQITPGIAIRSSEVRDSTLLIRTSTPFRLDTHYFIAWEGQEPRFLQPDGVLDSLYSDKLLGCTRGSGGYDFRVFAPRARRVTIVLYDTHNGPAAGELPMTRDADGVWEFRAERKLAGSYYGYRVFGPTGNGEYFDSTVVVADPYSRAVSTLNHYTHPGRTLILHEVAYDWQGDQGVRIDPRDLVIYETHLRDLTAHPSSGLAPELRGTYAGFINEEQRGGLPYVRSLGVNAVEFLPLQDFGNIEITYKDSSTWIYNTWNPYERNHWGYMTSYFFAPETYYSRGGTMERGAYNGQTDAANRGFKDLVRSLHQEGIAVLMDVVYNHVSQYDLNTLKHIDKFYYFRLTDECEFESRSGCGNDLKTERPMAQRLIIDSVLHWMREYHVDGFRFDLATLIDRETCIAITEAARAEDPDVILIAEPWHWGGYDPDGFSNIGWGAWNDQFRNGIKGSHPMDNQGFIFGSLPQDDPNGYMKRLLTGSLRELGGSFTEVSHSVNYLESHDDHTLGDFIRLALGEVTPDTHVEDVDAHARLSPEQLRINRLAALILLTSQGPAMIHEGQEYARSKVIAETRTPDVKVGHIDHNSYEKDDETNWLNFDHMQQNQGLVEYYQRLIRMRQEHPAFRRAAPGQYRFRDTTQPAFIIYELSHETGTYLVALNGSREANRQLPLPPGSWQVLANAEAVWLKDGPPAADNMVIPPGSGVVVQRRAE